MSGKITFQGQPLTLVGRAAKEGIQAANFTAASMELKEVRLADFKGKVKVINSFPSLDTPVCDLQVKEFNKKSSGVSSDVVIIGISKDLPFAQKRFCSANEIKNEVVISDYKTSSFGINYGLLIKELNLLARAVLIIDTNDIIRYVQIVPELTSAVNYSDALFKLEEVIKHPKLEAAAVSSPGQCQPCEGGVTALPKDEIDKLLASSRGWELIDNKKLVKEFKFGDFVEAKYFLDLLAVIAQEQGHHPNFSLIYNKLRVSLATHAAGGLTDNDFIMARIIDEIGPSLS